MEHWTVSELMRRLKDWVEPHFESFWVEGELSGVRVHSSGHVYFTLKDASAQVDCALFFGVRRSVSPAILVDGNKVRIRGKISIFEQRGKITLVVLEILPLGVGDILARLEELKRRLAAEGLFDPARKKPLPAFPRVIALVTSPTGAAVHDMIRMLRQKQAWARVVVVPAVVQGDEAPQSLVDALTYVNRWNLAEVIILGRGGGALEDLLPFSDERVVRAVAASKIPIVSAVGHQIDNPLCDLAADAAAPTPTAAIELIWPIDRDQWILRVREWKQNLGLSMRSRLQAIRHLLRPYALENWMFTLEGLLQPYRSQIVLLRETIGSAIQSALHHWRSEVKRLKEVLQAHNPLDILQRGYSVVEGPTGLVTAAEQAPPGTALRIRLARGNLAARSEGEYRP